MDIQINNLEGNGSQIVFSSINRIVIFFAKCKTPHLIAFKMNKNQAKATLLIHVFLGASDFTKIKTQERPRIGEIGDPVAELTKLGWVIMRLGKKSSHSNVLLITAAINTYEEPCSLDVKGLSDTHHLRKPIGVVLEKLIKLINIY